jgi:hypothetical protein
MGWPCGKHGREKKESHRIFVRNPERKGLLEILRRKWGIILKMDFRYLKLDGLSWLDFVDMVMKLVFPFP